MDDAKGLAIAFEEAKASYEEGGVPVSDPTLPATIAISRCDAGQEFLTWI